jgi:hypothetical protein
MPCATCLIRASEADRLIILIVTKQGRGRGTLELEIKGEGWVGASSMPPNAHRRTEIHLWSLPRPEEIHMVEPHCYFLLRRMFTEIVAHATISRKTAPPTS